MDSETARRIAHVGILVSAVSLVGILIAVPTLVLKANNLRTEADFQTAKFLERSDRIWSELMTFGLIEEIGKTNIQFFSRSRRSPWAKHICQGCNSLSCPMGPPGPAGPPGDDGLPGDPGSQGDSGDDGLDVQMEGEQDLPCVICPGGPPGQRGSQGERGRTGEQGPVGEMGPDGQSGADGPSGQPGLRGDVGLLGPIGPPGPPGETAVAGIGIKGPQGPPGPMGPLGPPGPKGKPSKSMGNPGAPGPVGPMGGNGNPGEPGMDGQFGPPGEPGEPAAYCSSDCGVAHIVAPTYIGSMVEEPSGASNYGGYDKQRGPNEYLWMHRL